MVVKLDRRSTPHLRGEQKGRASQCDGLENPPGIHIGDEHSFKQLLFKKKREKQRGASKGVELTLHPYQGVVSGHHLTSACHSIFVSLVSLSLNLRC